MKKYIGQHIFDYVASFRQNVGVGTDTPGEKLTVAGNIEISVASTGAKGLIFNENGTQTMGIKYQGGQSGNPIDIFRYQDNTTKVRFFENGNVDINSGVLTVNSGTTSVAVELISSNAGSYIRFDDGADANRWYIGAKNGAFILHNNSNVGVLTLNSNASATFSSDLTVSGNLTVSGTQTTINTTSLNVEDKNITINYSTGDSSSTADGAGITIQDAVDSSNDATILWDATNDKFDFSHGILLPDNKTLQLGSSTGSGDLQLVHDATNSYIKNHVGDLYIYNHTDDGDIIFQSDNGSGGLATYYQIDGGSMKNNFFKSLLLTDNVKTLYGTGSDLQIFHDGTDSKIHNDTGHLKLEIDADDKDLQVWADDQSGGLAEYFRVDGSLGINRFIRDSRHDDGIQARFGDGNDLKIVHDGFDSYVNNFTGNLNIVNRADDKDIIFQSDDGSGGVAEYFRLDGGATSSGALHTIWPDNSRVVFGSGSDAYIRHSGSDLLISNATGTMGFYQQADDGDMKFFCDDGSGGNAEYFRLDGGNTKVEVSKDFRFTDGARVQLGSGMDMQLHHTGGTNFIEVSTGGLNIRQNVNDGDIAFQCDDGSGGITDYIKLDGSETRVRFDQNLYIVDNVQARFGTGNDLRILHDGTHSYLTNYTGNFYFDQASDDNDMIFQCDDGSGGLTEYFRLDGGAAIIGVSREMRFFDNVKLKLGSGPDAEFYHNGTDTYLDNNTGNLNIRNTSDNNDIVFHCDDGSGGVTQYFRVDGGEEKVIFNKPVKFDFDVFTESNAELNLDAISTTGSGTVVKGGFLNPATEAQAVHQPQIVNDLAGFFRWGTIVTSGLFQTRSGSSGSFSYSNEWQASNSNWNRAFDSTSSHPGSFYSNNGVDGSSVTPGVIELQWPTEITYSLNVGIVFGSDSFTPTNVKIEAYKGDGAGGFAWQTLCDLTGNTENVILRKVDGNSGGGSATKRLKFTLGGSNTSIGYFRIHTIYMANYQAGHNNISGLGLDFTKGVHSLQKYDLNYVWGSFHPAQDNTYDLGSSSYEWKDGYFDGTVYTDGLNVDGNGEADRMTLNGSNFPQLFLIEGSGNSKTLQVGMSGDSAYFKKSDNTGSLIIRNSSNTNIALFDFATLNTTFGGSIIASGTVTAGGHVVGTTKAVVLVHGSGGVVGNSGSNSSDSHTWTITHGMGSSRDYKVEIIQNSGNYDTVHADITRPSDTTIVVTFSAAVANSAYKALILKCG